MLGTKVAHFRSHSQFFELVCQYTFEVTGKTLGSVKWASFWTILNMVGTSMLAGGGIRKLQEQMSFGNTIFQIAKRRCKDFLVQRLVV